MTTFAQEEAVEPQTPTPPYVRVSALFPCSCACHNVLLVPVVDADGQPWHLHEDEVAAGEVTQ